MRNYKRFVVRLSHICTLHNNSLTVHQKEVLMGGIYGKEALNLIYLRPFNQQEMNDLSEMNDFTQLRPLNGQQMKI